MYCFSLQIRTPIKKCLLYLSAGTPYFLTAAKPSGLRTVKVVVVVVLVVVGGGAV